MENKHTTRINMKCPSCNKEIDADSKFCEYCGTRIKNSTKGLWIRLGLVCALILTSIVVNVLRDQHTQQTVPQGYVDLDLPSGVLWKNANEGGDYGRYTYDEAVDRWGSKLPTKLQLQELIDECAWRWTGSGYRVTGPNGNSIFLPAAGERFCNGSVAGVGTSGYYWSSTPGSSGSAWRLYFSSNGVGMAGDNRCNGRPVRLVRN